MLQVFVQVLEPLVQGGTVLYLVTVALAEGLQRSTPRLVPVKVAVDPVVLVKEAIRAFQQRHRVQHEIVIAAAQAEHHPRKIVDEPLEKIAGVRIVVNKRNVLR